MKELYRLAGYLRPYLPRMIGAATMLALSGILMALAISTIKPLVNNVFIPAAEHAAGGEVTSSTPDILSLLKDWLPLDRLGDWGQKNYILVPAILVAIFFIRGLFQYFGQYSTIKAGASVIRDLRREIITRS